MRNPKPSPISMHEVLTVGTVLVPFLHDCRTNARIAEIIGHRYVVLTDSGNVIRMHKQALVEVYYIPTWAKEPKLVPAIPEWIDNQIKVFTELRKVYGDKDDQLHS